MRVLCGVFFTWVAALSQPREWVETTFEDFKDGRFERNIYCSRRSYRDRAPGAVEFVPRWDWNRDGYLDLVVSNIVMTGPSVHRDSVYIYLGGPDGYLPTRRLSYRTGGGGNVDGADINFDGYPELVIAHYRMWGLPGNWNPPDPCAVTVHWGKPRGPCREEYDSLPTSPQNEGVYLADLNRDGYIDVISGASPTSIFDLCIFWGSAAGFSMDSITILKAQVPRHNFEVADLDQDGYLDIVVVNYGRLDDAAPVHPEPMYIFWGGPLGYSQENRLDISYLGPYAHGLTVADFDKNGWLDLVFTGMRRVEEAWIYYGLGPRRFSDRPVVLKPGPCFGGSTAADFDRDGWLDLVFFVGNVDEAYRSRLYLYKGSEAGFSDAEREELGIREWNMSGGFVADCNEDGALDIFVHNWLMWEKSGVLWGPDYVSLTELPCNCDHHGMFREVGNPYDRSYSEDYISSVYDAGEKVNWDMVFWTDSCPRGSEVELWVRCGNTPTPDPTWSGWVLIGTRPGPVPDVVGGDTLITRYIQYRARLLYASAARLPVLYEVRITYEAGILVEPDQAQSTYPGQPVSYPLTVINLGTGEDVVDITRRSSTDWRVELYDSTGAAPLPDSDGDGVLDVGVVPPNRGEVDLWVRITPPLDAQAGDLDTTVIWGYSSNNSTVGDSAWLITSVITAPGVEVEPDSADSTLPGLSIRYPLRVTNEGNGWDYIEMTATSSRNWRVNLYDSTGAPLSDNNGNGTPDVGFLPPYGGKVDIWAEVVTPDRVPAGELDTTIVKGSSAADPDTFDIATLLTRIRLAPGVMVEPDQADSIPSGGVVDYRLRVTNTSNAVDLIDLVPTNTRTGWRVELLDSVGLTRLADQNNNGIPDVGPLPMYGGERWVCVRVAAPTFARAGEVDTTVVWGRSSNAQARDPASLITTVIPQALITVEPDQADTTLRGVPVDYLLTVTNNGNGLDTIDLTFTHTLSGWRVELYEPDGVRLLRDHNRNGIPDLPGVAPFGGTANFIARVTPPPDARFGSVDTTVVTGHSSISPQMSEEAVLVTFIRSPVVSIRVGPDTVGVIVRPDSTASYRLRVVSEGDEPIYVDLTLYPDRWDAGLSEGPGGELSDRLRIGPIQPGDSLPFWVVVCAPSRLGSIVGQVDSVITEMVVVEGVATLENLSSRDSASVFTTLAPPLDIHNYPNPFGERTTFIFSLPDTGLVTLRLFNRAGEYITTLIDREEYPLGIHTYPWDGTNRFGKRVAPGVYLYPFTFKGNRVYTGGKTITKKALREP